MKSIVQIELTNHCNRRCAYCGQTNMTRDKGFMSDQTLMRCIWVLRRLKQESVGVHHFGESMMHPKFIPFLRKLNDADITPWLNTNGDFLSDEMIDDLAKLKLASLVISGHAPTERKQMLYQKCADKGIKAWWQPDFGDTNTIGLAGQIDYEKAYDKSYPPLQDPQNHCRFLVEEQAVIYFNGDLVPCCIDYNGCGVFGNIFNENVLELTPKANKLCQTCPGHPGNVI